MKIQIENHADHYTADLLDLPGTPPIGKGLSPEEAVASLFMRILHPSYTRETWTKHIDYNDVKIIRIYNKTGGKI